MFDKISVTLEIAAVTDIGQSRSSNQDNFFVNNCYIDHSDIIAERFEAVDNQTSHVMAVCDGMGGEADGDVAALIGVSTIAEFASLFDRCDTTDEAARLAKETIYEASARVLEQSKKSNRSMGSTLSMLVVRSNYIYACNVGDSEIYHKHQYGIERLSKPHTLAQQMVDMGAMSENQASQSYHRNQLVQYLGMSSQRRLRPNDACTSIKNGDMLLICSDGVSDVLPDHTIYASLNSSRPVGDIADAIIRKAIKKGSSDNLTVVLARVIDDGRLSKLKQKLITAAGFLAAAAIVALSIYLLF